MRPAVLLFSGTTPFLGRFSHHAASALRRRAGARLSSGTTRLPRSDPGGSSTSDPATPGVRHVPQLLCHNPPSRPFLSHCLLSHALSTPHSAGPHPLPPFPSPDHVQLSPANGVCAEETRFDKQFGPSFDDPRRCSTSRSRPRRIRHVLGTATSLAIVPVGLALSPRSRSGGEVIH
jgi:hypothetical protein